jgi:hypothetical protein
LNTRTEATPFFDTAETVLPTANALRAADAAFVIDCLLNRARLKRKGAENAKGKGFTQTALAAELDAAECLRIVKSLKQISEQTCSG